MKEFHLHIITSNNNIDRIFNSYYTTKQAIDLDIEEIHSTQVILCTTDLFKKGYRIFIHLPHFKVMEIKLGSKNNNTNREIKMKHNLPNLILAGEFGDIMT